MALGEILALFRGGEVLFLTTVGSFPNIGTGWELGIMHELGLGA